MDLRLRRVIEEIGPDKWAAMVLDASNTLVWLSAEMKAFLGASSDAEAGVGQHAIVGLFRPVWRNSMTLDSQLEVFKRAFPFLLEEGVPPELIDQVPEDFRDLLASVEPQPQPPCWTGSFDYVNGDLPTYPVQYVVTQLRDTDGERIGTLIVSNMGLRPTLLASLARGDAAMYERMAALTQPGRHATAILFADLEGSGELSRQLPTASYFEVIQDLTTVFDTLVAEHDGIVGKHVGDGWTAFFLAEHTGGVSAAAAAAIEVARGVQRRAEVLTGRLAARAAEARRVDVNVGVHWGPGVYLGQLVPGGRLDVTALGDEVNECARIQECARGGCLLASKQVMELLDPADAALLGVDPAGLLYESLAGMPAATDKTRRDAATVAVTTLS